MLTPKPKRDLLKGAIVGWLTTAYVSASITDITEFQESIDEDADRIYGLVDSLIDSEVDNALRRRGE